MSICAADADLQSAETCQANLMIKVQSESCGQLTHVLVLLSMFAKGLCLATIA